MATSYKEQLNDLTQSSLVDLVLLAIDNDKSFANVVKLKIAESDPKLLEKQLKQQINGIKRSKRFLDYYESLEMGKKLDVILDTIETKLFPLSPSYTMNCCELLANISVGLIERADDSSGTMGDALRRISAIWGNAAASLGGDNGHYIETVFHLWQKDEYNLFAHVFNDFKTALGIEGLKALQSRISQMSVTSDYDRHNQARGLKSIADALGDVDAYIAVCTNNQLSAVDTIEIAERLNRKERGVEALAWLEKFDTPNQYIRQDLHNRLVKAKIAAYELEFDEDSAQAVRWEAFEETLSPHYYLDYCRYINNEQKLVVKEKALTMAGNRDSIGEAIYFLDEIQEYALLSDFLLENTQNLNDVHYSFLRPLSKRLAANGYGLAATVLRRSLVEGILNKAQSKYYKYAISDLKLAKDYSHHVTDWRGIVDHTTFVDELRHAHPRKMAFWTQIDDK